jgi:hypothetical protein
VIQYIKIKIKNIINQRVWNQDRLVLMRTSMLLSSLINFTTFILFCSESAARSTLIIWTASVVSSSLLKGKTTYFSKSDPFMGFGIISPLGRKKTNFTFWKCFISFETTNEQNFNNSTLFSYCSFLLNSSFLLRSIFSYWCYSNLCHFNYVVLSFYSFTLFYCFSF